MIQGPKAISGIIQEIARLSLKEMLSSMKQIHGIGVLSKISWPFFFFFFVPFLEDEEQASEVNTIINGTSSSEGVQGKRSL